jgi:hypothetical protein
MTRRFRPRSLTAVVAAMVATCTLVLADNQTPSAKQVQSTGAPSANQLLPVITGIVPVGTDRTPVIQAGRAFTIFGRNFPADPAAVSIVISSAPYRRPGRKAAPSQEVATLRPSAASAARLDVLAPVSLPAGTGRYLVHVVTKAGARSNEFAVQYDAERQLSVAKYPVTKAGARSTSVAVQPGEAPQLTIAGYLRDTKNNGFPGIRITATDPAKPTPYEAWTDSSGHYALRVPAPFTGQVLVQRPNNCFDCTLITHNLANQTSDLSDVNFVCSNTTIIVGRTQTQYNEIISGVRLDGLPGGPVTNNYGDYQVTVPCGWSGTVTPVKAGWAFSPPSFSYSSLTQRPPRQDYIGTALFYRISGTVRTSAGVPIAGVKMGGLYPRSANESNVTDASGSYGVAVYYGWSGTATPVKAGYSFSPASRSYTSVVASQQGQDYVGTPTTTVPLAQTAAGPAARAGGDSTAIVAKKALEPTRQKLDRD